MTGERERGSREAWAVANGRLAISVVICAYTEERWPELLRSIESVRDQTLEPAEIILVIDHNPALLARARAELAGLTVVDNVRERGLGGARNSGVAAASGDVVAFLDDDAVASPRLLEEFARAYRDPTVAGVGGAIEPMWSAEPPRWFPEEFGWVLGCTYRGMPEGPASVRNLIGCNMSFRRELLEALGGFRLGYGCDETELCIRLGRQWPEKALRYVPDARAFHSVSASRMRWSHFWSRCYFEGGSKAVVTWLCGAGEGLASERAYTFRTLPGGVVRGMSDALLRGDVAGLARAGAIVSGLAVTTAGYVMGKLSVRDAARRRGWSEERGGSRA